METLADTTMTDLTEDSKEPDWEGLRAEGRMVLDTENNRLAVYVGDQGHVVVARSEFDALPADVLVLDVKHVPALVEALNKIQGEAKLRETEFWREVDESYSKHLATDLIERVSDAARKDC